MDHIDDAFEDINAPKCEKHIELLVNNNDFGDNDFEDSTIFECEEHIKLPVDHKDSVFKGSKVSSNRIQCLRLKACLCLVQR